MHGDRRAGTGASTLSDFDVDNRTGTAALKEMMTSITRAAGALGASLNFSVGRRARNEQEDLPAATVNIMPSFLAADYSMAQFAAEAALAMRDCGMVINGDKTPLSVKTFLNRLFGMPVAIQGKIFKYFHDTYEAFILEAKVVMFLPG
jgi:hypothetical protein